MSDSLALKCAKLEQELLRSRAALNLPIVLQEEEDRAEAARVVVSAMRGQPEQAGATIPTGIYNVALKIEIKHLNTTGAADLLDQYLFEIDSANLGAPVAPSAGYAAAAAALALWIWKDDDDTTQDDGENTRRAERTFTVMAKELDA